MLPAKGAGGKQFVSSEENSIHVGALLNITCRPHPSPGAYSTFHYLKPRKIDGGSTAFFFLGFLAGFLARASLSSATPEDEPRGSPVGAASSDPCKSAESIKLGAC